MSGKQVLLVVVVAFVVSFLTAVAVTFLMWYSM